jgi:hypothetical protein
MPDASNVFTRFKAQLNLKFFVTNFGQEVQFRNFISLLDGNQLICSCAVRASIK